MAYVVPNQIIRGPNPPEKYVQPGYGPEETFSPAKQAPVCPLDGGKTKAIGSSDFEYVCETCGAQFRQNGTQSQAHQHAQALILRPNVERS
jgi:hypothetical protein